MTNRIFTLAMVPLFMFAISGEADAENKTKQAEDEHAMFEFEHVSCNGAPNQIRIVVSDIKRSVGLITADLYLNDKENFLRKAGRATRVRFAAHAPYTKFCVSVPEAGDYAVAVYHDKNANRKLDKGAFGLPSEPWGLSKNPKIRFRKPRVEEALFNVAPDGATMEIKLND